MDCSCLEAEFLPARRNLAEIKRKFLPEGRGSFTVCERQQLKVLCLVLKLCCMYTLHMLIQIQ